MRDKLLLLIFCLLWLPCVAQQKTYEPYHGDGVDDVLRWMPAASVVVLKACGVSSSGDTWGGLALQGGGAMLLSAGTTLALKHIVHERRPDGTDTKAFPSGHAALAFCGATVLHKEFGRVSPWISVAGYGVATFAAIDRVCRNRHDWIDVGAGAAIGVLSAELTYWLGKRWSRRQNVDVALNPTCLYVAWHL